MHARTLFPRSAWLCLLAGLAAVPGRARAESVNAATLEEGAARTAAIVQTILNKANVKEVFVQPFRPFASAEIELDLPRQIGAELTKLGFTVREGARYQVEGRILRLPRDAGKPLKGISIQGQVVSQDGDKRSFEKDVDVINPNQAVHIVQPTSTVHPPPVNPVQPPKAEPTLGATRIYPSPKSPYSIEVLLDMSPSESDVKKKRFVPQKVTLEGGVPKVSLQRGEVYAVKVYNDTDYEAVAQVYIDGLSRYALSDKEADRNLVDLIAPKGQRLILGYYRNASSCDAFLVGEYSKSEAARLLPKSDKVGTITVTFAAAWKKGDRIPPHEYDDLAITSDSGTLRGPPRRDPMVTVQREIGKVRSVIKVRY
jgi:hypothetical protein